MPFSAANPALARALTARGYTALTPVQEKVLEPDAAARDLLVSAQTGSGKTVAYGLAFAPTLLGAETSLPQAGAPLALIIAPTRELAMQVARELEWLYAETGARIATCIGGMDGQAEGRRLAAGAHIVVGTPGRLCDHLRRGRLNLTDLRVLVLDEADEMLDLGFREELDQILAEAPEWRRTLLFSATIAKEITALARSYQKDVLRIDTLQRNQPHADIEYRAVRVLPRETEHAIVNVLRYVESPTALIFCGTREGVRHLQASLTERGFTSVALSGELSQNERSRALHAIRDGQARICVATDVAARGLDLPDLDLVIHADLPTNKATLLHRSGRTGRAGRKGMCVVIVPAHRERAAAGLFASANVQAQWSGPPGAAEIRALDCQRLRADPLLAEAVDPEDEAFVHDLAAGRTAEELAAALLRLYRARLPAAEELAEPPPARIPGAAAPARQPRSPSGARARIEGLAPPPRAESDGPMVWFGLSAGRHAKADPKWLLPLICRLGGVERGDIGAIRILDRESRFEIRAEAAAAFEANLPEPGADEVRVFRSAPPPMADTRAAPARKKPFIAPGGKKPFRKFK